MYIIKLSNTRPNCYCWKSYYFEKKPTYSDKLGACLEYLEYLLGEEKFWRSVIERESFLSFTERDNRGFLSISIMGSLNMNDYRLVYIIEKLESPRPLNAFFTSNCSKIRKFVKGEALTKELF